MGTTNTCITHPLKLVCVSESHCTVVFEFPVEETPLDFGVFLKEEISKAVLCSKAKGKCLRLKVACQAFVVFFGRLLRMERLELNYAQDKC